MMDTADHKWPVKFGPLDLAEHMDIIRHLMKKASGTPTEHYWYYAMNTAYTFNGLRKSTKAYCVLVYPQAGVGWLLSSPSDETTTTKSNVTTPATDGLADSTARLSISAQDSVAFDTSGTSDYEDYDSSDSVEVGLVLPKQTRSGRGKHLRVSQFYISLTSLS